MSRRIYLDFNATTPLAPEAAAAMRPFLVEPYGNPSSPHWAGIPARDAVETARSQVAGLLCCDATEIVFTSGGTEANNHAIKGAVFAQPKHSGGERPHVITSRIEHPAVLEPCRFLERLGAEVTRLPVDRHGLVDPDAVRRAIRPGTVLVSIMHANNEVGTVQPVEEIARIARERDVLCHTDAAQTVGKVPVDVESLGVDLLSVAGHKLYGPKGVGALFVREGVELEPLLHGAAHEAGRRAGTENVLEIVGLGAACDAARRWIEDTSIARLRDHFQGALQERLGAQVVLNGHPERRLPNTLSVGFRGRIGGDLLAALPQVAASTGSACHAGSLHVSPVLEAMGVAEEVALGTVRFSLGRTTTREEVEAVVRCVVTRLAIGSSGDQQ
ncbi:MAG: cysteine desulfurase family protein [Planctomycetales bacterium]